MRMDARQRIDRCFDGQVCDTNADAFVAMGAAYANHDQLESALKHLTKALEIDPAHPNAQKYLEVRRCVRRHSVAHSRPVADCAVGCCRLPSTSLVSASQCVTPHACPFLGV